MTDTTANICIGILIVLAVIVIIAIGMNAYDPQDNIRLDKLEYTCTEHTIVHRKRTNLVGKVQIIQKYDEDVCLNYKRTEE